MECGKCGEDLIYNAQEGYSKCNNCHTLCVEDDTLCPLCGCYLELFDRDMNCVQCWVVVGTVREGSQDDKLS